MVAMADKVVDKLVNMVVDNMADNVADNVAENVEDNEIDTSSAIAHTVKWTIMLLNFAESVSRLNMKHSLAIETPPGKLKELDPRSVTQKASSRSESTSNLPAINATKSIMALPYYPQPQIANHSDWPTMQPHSSQPLL